MKALIFGASGQDGHYLAGLCRASAIEPIGVSRSGTGVRANVAETAAVRDLVHHFQPAYVFHLAAESTLRHEALFENHATISLSRPVPCGHGKIPWRYAETRVPARKSVPTARTSRRARRGLGNRISVAGGSTGSLKARARRG